ncbi:PABP2 protein, partial [Polypterus senegalus]
MAEYGNGLAEESLLDSDPGHPELEDPGAVDEEPGLEEGETTIEDPELEAIKARVREMEEEAEKLKELQNEVEKQMNLSPPPGHAEERIVQRGQFRAICSHQIQMLTVATLPRTALPTFYNMCTCCNVYTSLYVVVPITLKERLTLAEFAFLGEAAALEQKLVNVTSAFFFHHLFLFAYIEFADKESVRTAMALDESLFRGRQIKVGAKRTNRPGISTTDRGFPRARFRSRGTFSTSRARYYSGYTPPRGRGRAFRHNLCLSGFSTSNCVEFWIVVNDQYKMRKLAIILAVGILSILCFHDFH